MHVLEESNFFDDNGLLGGGKGGEIAVLVVVIPFVSANNDLNPKPPVCYGSRNGTKEVEYDRSGT